MSTDPKTGSTYYLTKHKSQKQGQQFAQHQFSTKAATGKTFMPDSSLMSGSYMTSPQQTGHKPARKTIGTRGSNKTHFDERTTFKKRHVSQKVEERTHSTQVKNMNLIQRQLAANTSYAKNRLAFDRSRLAPANTALSSQGQTFRSQTVGSNRKGSQQVANDGILALGKKQMTAETSEADLSATMPNLGSIVRIQVQTADVNKRQRYGIEPAAQTWSSSFEPLGLLNNNTLTTATAAQALNKTQNPFTPGDKVPIRSLKQKRDFKTPDGRRQMINVVNNMRVSAQTQSSFDARANTVLDNQNSLGGEMDKEITNLKVLVGQRGGGATSRFGAEQRSPSAFAARTQVELLDSNARRLTSEGPDQAFASDKHLTLEKKSSHALSRKEHDGFLNQQIQAQVDLFGSQTVSPVNSKMVTRQPLLTAAEMGGKRIVNNITEVQSSKITDDNPSHQIGQLQMSSHLTVEPSYLPTQNSALFSSSNAGKAETHFTALTSASVASTQGSCQKCRMWKRINQAVRNIANRTNLQEMPSALTALQEVIEIDSIQKTVPNLTKLLQSLHDNLQSQFSEQVGKMESEVLQLRAKLTQLDADNKAFKAERDQLDAEYQKVKDFIFGSRFNSVHEADAWKAFLEEDAKLRERVLENKQKQHELCYSGLFSVMTDQELHVKNQGELLGRTIDYLKEKILQNKNNSVFHHHLDEIFVREQYLQRQVVRDFMTSHFRYGLDPPVQTFERGTVTSRNMISEKYGYMSKAEKFQRELETRQRETITQVKMENSLLMQQNTELQQEVDYLNETQEALEVKVEFFKEYDIGEVKKATEEYGKLAQEQQITQLRLTESEEQRRKMHIELKDIRKEREHFDKFLLDQLAYHLKLFEDFKFIRTEIQHPENEDEVHRLDVALNHIATKSNDYLGKRQTTALMKRLGEEQRKHISASMEYLKSCIAFSLANNRPLMCNSQMTNVLTEQIRQQLLKEFQAGKADDLAAIAELKAQVKSLQQEFDAKETELYAKFAKDLKDANELAKKNAKQAELKHQETIRELKKQQTMALEKPVTPAKPERKSTQVKPNPVQKKSSKKASLLNQITKRTSGTKKQVTRTLTDYTDQDENLKQSLDTDDLESEPLSAVESAKEDDDGEVEDEGADKGENRGEGEGDGDGDGNAASDKAPKQKPKSGESKVQINVKELYKVKDKISSMEGDKARIGKQEVNLVLEEHPQSRQNSNSQQHISIKVPSLHESHESLDSKMKPLIVNESVMATTKPEQKPLEHTFTFTTSKLQQFPTLDQIQPPPEARAPIMIHDYMRRENTQGGERLQNKSVPQLYPGDVQMQIAYFDPKHRMPTPPKGVFGKKNSEANPKTEQVQGSPVYQPLANGTKERRAARHLLDNSKEIQCNILNPNEKNTVLKFEKMVQTEGQLDFMFNAADRSFAASGLKFTDFEPIGRQGAHRSSTVPRNVIDHLSHSKDKGGLDQRASRSQEREPSIYSNTKPAGQSQSDENSQENGEKCKVKVIPDDILNRAQASLHKHRTDLQRSPVRPQQAKPKMYDKDTLSISPGDLHSFSYTPRKNITAQALSKLMQERVQVPADADYIQESVMLEIKSIQSPPNNKQKNITVELEDTHRLESESDMLEQLEQAAKYHSYLQSTKKTGKKKKQQQQRP